MGVRGVIEYTGSTTYDVCACTFFLLCVYLSLSANAFYPLTIFPTCSFLLDRRGVYMAVVGGGVWV